MNPLTRTAILAAWSHAFDIKSVVFRPIISGWSQACVWAVQRSQTDESDFVLKQHSEHVITQDRLEWIHQRLQMAKPLHITPRPIATRTGHTVLALSGTLWELLTWLPGQVDAREPFPQPLLDQAFAALGKLHACWQRRPPDFQPCPGVLRRFQVFARWKLVQAGQEFPVLRTTENEPLAEAWERLPGWIAEAERLLAPDRDRLVPIQPCLVDVHHGNLLSRGDTLTGIIDASAMMRDDTAMDLARLAGDTIPGEPDRLARALECYQQTRGGPPVPREYVQRLAYTGLIGALANWMIRWRSGNAPEGCHQRVAYLLRRIKAFRPE